MKPIIIPQTYNYIATFLSLACNLRCSYCINYFEEEGKFLKKAYFRKRMGKRIKQDCIQRRSPYFNTGRRT